MGDFLEQWQRLYEKWQEGGLQGNPAQQAPWVPLAPLAEEESKRRQQWAMQQVQQQRKSYFPRDRSYPFAIDEDYILIEWARRRMGEFEVELQSKFFLLDSTTLPPVRDPWNMDPWDWKVPKYRLVTGRNSDGT